ncbi:intradiol ring-cleavage dioxygenase [Streptomyces millisiae]|uniref:Intradiol ring-cleavage dioxygenase n=1 Tax=Streptomyces millisiae TaxID=3075542 RepID=A0ABU2LPL0_9ACTN|nr:intradiol ring-cleavage dioxygenase [Streptomyces sp. DSM 44918]MDT0319522.1 intradiol ring-cleavage dioxygenase [Streptomyces sp. DSM 44918]
MSEEELHDHDRGLSFDLPTLARRRMLVLSGGGLLAVAGCAAEASGGGSASATTEAAETDAECAAIPDETGGPYPADGSNGVNVLTQSGIVRGDITRSFGTASGVAEGVPLTIELTVLDAASGCGAAMQGAAVYLWHCDRDGNYSLYSQGVENENYLRGVQETDADGRVTFTSVFPACYAGRWPHIHFEVYQSLEQATAAGNAIKTSQLALPEDVCDTVYDTEGYGRSIQNFAQVSLDTDNVFSDGSTLQLATVTGDADQGYVASLRLGV